MGLSATSSKNHRLTPNVTLETTVAHARETQDARRIEAFLAEIAGWPGVSDEVVVSSLKSVLEKQRVFNSVAIVGLHQLRIRSALECSAFARELLREPPSDDRETVHSRAISALIESGCRENTDFEAMSKCVTHPFLQVRSACQRALRDLSDKQRVAILAELSHLPQASHGKLRVFLETASSVPAVACAGRQAELPKSAPEARAYVRCEERLNTAKLPRKVEKKEKSTKAPDRKLQDDCSSSHLHELAVPKTASGIVRDYHHCSAELERSNKLFASLRRTELATLSLEALRNGASAAAGPADVLAYLSEIAIRFGPCVAADHIGRLIWLLSDPLVADKRLLGDFSQELIREASKEESQ